VLVDLTAAEGMDEVYEEAFRRGIDVVGANKHPLAVPWLRRERVAAVCRLQHRNWRYETTVGASLPLIDTLQSLVRTGDRILAVEGALSGTLGHVTTELMKGVPPSLSIRWARELGYSEPDPRDDLSGLDSARKAIILAREIGVHADVADAEVEPLVPGEALAPGSLDDLYEGLRRCDDALLRRAERARREGKALRYLVRIGIERGRAAIAVGPAEVDPGHRAAHLSGVESYVAFTTERYRDHPLVVQGAGVGGESTAGGVLADVFKIAARRGAF
jgi:homoserine dehydrogenase